MGERSKESLAGTPIDRLAWLQGRWIGEQNGERIEEHWSAPECGMMMGMFRWTREGKVWLTEHFTIESEPPILDERRGEGAGGEGSGLVLRIKHFHPGLTAWEEKEDSVTFDLVEIRPSFGAWLRRGGKGTMWLLYERKGDVLEAWFEKENEPGPFEGRFRYVLRP